MTSTSPYALARQLELDIRAALAANDTADMPAALKQTLSDLKHVVTDARLDVRDYEVAETHAQQGRLARVARDRLEVAGQHIVAASQDSVFSAIDVAYLSASIESIKDQLL